MIEKYVSTQSRNVGLLKKCRFAQLQPLAPYGFGFHKSGG